MIAKQYKYLWLSIVVVFLDQISKIIVRITMPIGNGFSAPSIPVLGELFKLTHVQNCGAAFSLSLGSATFNRIAFTAITAAFLIVIFFILKKTESKVEQIAYPLIIGGAIGNLIDRVFIGGVTDFLDVDFPDFIMERWPIFNIADSAIVVAITILIIYFIFFEKKALEAK
ncbi:MAG: signal peptidase II [Candidatus Cloacimonadales bacterium]|jgi:signal peptidase II|nr:signal peptidase II [Candidatus Cloacimonadota bacterium]MDD2651080.1 signal peptidase II [Candidatus Cloacimonadota bacterium]MDX9977846.1 signal peptidase II [Candidatus Cloacimonadales bacterium]